MLYYIILYYTISHVYYTILYYIILYYTILYYIILYNIILYYIILYYIILYYIILYYIHGPFTPTLSCVLTIITRVKCVYGTCVVIWNGHLMKIVKTLVQLLLLTKIKHL